MTQSFVSRGALAACTAVLATPSFADITPADVWDSWQSYLSGFTLDMTATEQRTGDDILVTDVSISFEVPDEDGTVTITLPDMDFISRGDGTVEMKYGADMSVTARIEGEGGPDSQATIDIVPVGLSTIASGEPNDITYTYSAASLTYSVAEVLVEGAPIAEIGAQIEGDVTVTGMTGLVKIATEGLTSIQQDVRYDSMTYDVRFVAPEDDGSFVTAGTVDDLRVESALSISQDIDLENPFSIFNEELNISIEASQGASQSSMSGNDGNAPFSSESASASGSFGMLFNSDVLEASMSSFDASFNFFGEDIPLPVSGEVGEASMSFSLPLAETADPQDFFMNFAIVDAIIPDLLWNIFDPGAALERGPATISVGMEGTTKLMMGAFNPAFFESDDVPATLESLSLTDLEVSVAGAELTGAGDFTFDNTDLSSFDGFPRPEGAADFRLTGGNQLLDSLISMGLVSEGDAMGARMMMGVFTVAGPGDDELNSRLEVTGEGHVLANGQRLR
ncbi:hypothetical protein [Cognatishimia sp.]|uniref:hypothetical protein n=1 Tax=Cognatishimia sp. TaxID=2211648 RepID=UPI0035171937